MKRFFLDPWFIAWALPLLITCSVVAYGNIHTGEPLSRLSPWNWAWVALIAALVIGARSYQYFKQHR